MVLWEITLVTAYCLGLKRTYRLVLRLQRRLLSKHPRLRTFVFRRARGVFDVALKAHRTIQQRDIAAGKSIGNRILRFLDRARPSANISGTKAPSPNSAAKLTPNDPVSSKTECNRKPQQERQQQQQQSGGGGGGGGDGGGGVRNINFVQTLHLSDTWGPFPTANSLPRMVLESYWSPLKKRLASSHQHRKLCGVSDDHSSLGHGTMWKVR